MMLMYAGLAAQVLLAVSGEVVYPEVQVNLQRFQDVSWGFADFGEWHLEYRNFHEDIIFGGNVKSLKPLRHRGSWGSGTPVILTYQDDELTSGSLTLSSSEGYRAKNVLHFNFCQNNRTVETRVIFKKRNTCLIIRHPHISNGFGCSFWRHSSALAKDSDCCEFIYDQNCGTTPKYHVKPRRCTRGSSC